MKSQIAILTIILLTVSSQISYSTDVSGDVWGEWTATANPYNVVGDLRVPPGSTLVIGPGCYIEFQGYYQFLVDTSAVLQAIGTEIDSIIFTTADSTITWEGLCFLYSDSGSQLSYCRFERGNGVIESDYSYLEISNSLFQNNYGSGGAAYLRDNHYIIIENNYIRANRGFSAIYSARNSQVELSGNIFTNNDSMTIIMSAYNYDTLSVTENIFSENISCVIAEIDGRGISIENNFIYDNSAIMFICWQGSGPTLFRRNIIYDNYCPWSFAGGIFLTEDSYIIVENNTICNNSGVYRSYLGMITQEHGTNSPAIFKNNIIWGNYYINPEDSLFLIDHGINFYQTYSNVQGGWSGTGNINTDPLFVDTANGDFHLMPGSPCIDAGDPASPLDPDSTRADMGALYFDQLTGIIQPPMLPREITLYQNYPNPFNAGTKISFTIYDQSDVTINVFDMLGRKVSTLLAKQLQAGEHTVNWDGKSDSGERMSSGVYFYNLKTDTFEDSKKMVILK